MLPDMSDTDLELLARYTRQHAEDAFAEIIRRHVGLVYSAALRQVRSPQLAEEVAQSVFIDLARSAAKLKPDTILTAWLYQVTRRTAIDVVRREASRQLREQIATEMNAMNATAADWTHIEPLLDEAMHALDDTDRTAVLLRYFENKSLREVGATLGTSDDAAQKRVSRAIERLREFFAKRGVTVGASGLVVVISANAVQAAPVGLVVTISTAAVLGGTTIAATTATSKTLVMTTLQKTLVAATVTVLVGVGGYEALLVSRLREQNQTLRQQQTLLAEHIEQLQREKDEAANRLSALADEIQRVKGNTNSTELLRLRSEVGVLRQQSALSKTKSMSPAEAVAKVMNDSSAIELARIQLRQTLKNHYAPLTQQLNLAPETTEKLFNLIIENELKKKVALAQLMSGDSDTETALQGRDQAKAELENQIKELLGDAGYAQLDQFNHDTAAGELVKGLNRELGDKALNDEQSKRIQALFAAKPDITIDDMDLLRSKESLNGLLQQLVDRGHHDLEEAASFLTSEQLAAAKTIQSNYFNTISNQMTLGHQLINKAKKSR
jgi:RNA polymerase sigma factor (sigma-70 family)